MNDKRRRKNSWAIMKIVKQTKEKLSSGSYTYIIYVGNILREENKRKNKRIIQKYIAKKKRKPTEARYDLKLKASKFETVASSVSKTLRFSLYKKMFRPTLGRFSQ